MSVIDTPFNKRQQCWFCGEPNQFLFSFPNEQHFVLHCPHPALKVPACKECYGFAMQVKADSIWQVNALVKQRIMHIYRKDLAIGLNWNQAELASSEFEGGNFEGFKKSAWFIYEVAKQRVNYRGWLVALNGVEIENSSLEDDFKFNFDGVSYPTVEDAIEHYCYSFNLNMPFFKRVLNHFGEKNFASAIRYARLFVAATPNEQSSALDQLIRDNI